MKKMTLLLFCFLSLQQIGLAQMSVVSGKVTDEESGEELIGANITFEKNGVFAAGAVTDFDGNYSILLDPGTYEVLATYTGYVNLKITGLVIEAGRDTNLDVEMDIGDFMLCGPICFGYTIRLIDVDNTTSGHTIDHETIRNQPSKTINDLLLMAPGVSISQ